MRTAFGLNFGLRFWNFANLLNYLFETEKMISSYIILQSSFIGLLITCSFFNLSNTPDVTITTPNFGQRWSILFGRYVFWHRYMFTTFSRRRVVLESRWCRLQLWFQLARDSLAGLEESRRGKGGGDEAGGWQRGRHIWAEVPTEPASRFPSFA